jgi:protein phosphatase
MLKHEAEARADAHPSPTETSAAAPSGFTVAAIIQTDVGCVREANEDASTHVSPTDPHLLATKGALTVVADGMGGHASGEVASRMAVEHVTRLYYQRDAPAHDALKYALEEANRQVYAASLADERFYGMGTTCTALAIVGDAGICGHIGDSRLYLLRDDQLRLMTEDHSAVMELIKLGVITPEEARRHPEKNIILRALGTTPEVEADTWDAPLPLHTGDAFLLCSDGLYDLVQDAEIKLALSSFSPQEASARLIQLAKERGGFDNITIAIVKIEG